MAVHVKISATLRRHVAGYSPLKGATLDHRPGLTVSRALESLGIPAKEVKIIMVNGIHASLDHELSDGDRLGLFPPVGGG